jgi:NifU-like protein involved in Fe-S cluster formation
MPFRKRIQVLKELVRSSPYRCLIADATSKSTISHPSCGDEVVFSARIEDGKVVEIGVLGSGCLLSQAAGILAAEYAHGRLLLELAYCSDALIVERLSIGQIGPTRRQCITIAIEAIKQLAKL